MQVTRKLNSTTVVEAEAPTMVELFEQLSALEEVFRQACGMCKSTHVTFRTREVNNIKFHEVACIDCGAALALGMRKGAGGALFPRRKDAETGKWLANGGWSKYSPPGNGNAPTTTQQPDELPPDF